MSILYFHKIYLRTVIYMSILYFKILFAYSNLLYWHISKLRVKMRHVCGLLGLRAATVKVFSLLRYC